MKNILIYTALGINSLLISCQNNTPEPQNDNVDSLNISTVTTTENNNSSEISYTIAENYFVKNTVKTIDNPLFETKEAFEAVFGMAPVMGKGGQPTEIDFSKQFVIALATPVIDTMCKIEPMSLQKNDAGEIVLRYKIKMGEKISYQIRASLILVVDKANVGKVVLEKEG